MARRCDLTGKGVMTGNNVSHANNRTRRRFLPNLQQASMMSEALGKTISLRVSTSAIRSVEKNGGIDSYLMKAKDSNLGVNALAAKREILSVMKNPAKVSAVKASANPTDLVYSLPE